MRPDLLTWILFVALSLFPLGSRLAFSQGTDSVPERILNPLPDYDPFVKPTPLPKFFPDEVDRRVRELLIDSLTNSDGTLEEHVRFFAKKDDELLRELGLVTGLREHATDLFHNTIRDRDRYLEAEERELSFATSPQRKHLLESRLRNDDLNQANELLRKNSANRWGAWLNRLLGSVDLVSILSGSYIGAAAESAMSQLLGAASAEMSLEERKALALYLKHLKRYPDYPKNEEIRKQVERLDEKKRILLVRKQVDKAEEAIGKGEFDRAAFHYQMASMTDPASAKVNNGLERLRKILEDVETEQKRGLSLAKDETRRVSLPAEEEDLRQLLYALALRSPEQIEAQARALREKYPQHPLGDAAWDASSVALEVKGRHEEAKKVLEKVARSSHSSHERQRAEFLLKSSEYNLLASFREAQSQRRLETVKYVLLGEDLLKKNLLYGAAPLITAGPAGATSVAAANVLMIGTNLFEVLTANPVSQQPVVDKGLAYIRDHPQSESSTEVYKVLAEAYEERGIYDKAIAYWGMSGQATDEKIADLKEKAAKSLLQAAERSGERSAKENYLNLILLNFGESPAARQATRKLAALARTENQGLRMSKKFLQENPELYGAEGLRLKPALFDGNLSNMELADRGVNLPSEREIVLHFDTPWGTRSQTYSIGREMSERLQMTLRKKNYEVAMEDVHVRPKGSPGGIKTLPLPILRGELDRKVEEPSDTTLSLVREARGPRPSFATVLDHDLVSEREKTGGKFKLPPIQGNLGMRGFDLSGALPSGPWGDRITMGADTRSPYAGVQLPIPLLQGFIPVDFMFQGRPGGLSVFPKIHLYGDKGDDKELYR